MSFIIGIDIGTTNTKAVAFTDDGKVLGNAWQGYIHMGTGITQLDPDELFSTFIDVLQKVLAQTAGQGQPAGVCFSCAMHSIMAVDRQGRPLTRAITWADQRSKDFADDLKAGEAGRDIYRQTGTPIHPMSPLPKLLWLRAKEPDIFERAAKFISIKEYIWWKLFGKYQVDHSIASATGLFDIYHRTWYRASLELAGIDEARLSQPVPCTHIETARSSGNPIAGLPQDIPFIIGGSDGCLANLGSNAVAPGETALTIGTSGALRMTTRQPKYDASERIFHYVLSDELYVSGGASSNGAGAVQWYAGNFLAENSGLGTDRLEEVLEEAGSVAPGSDGLIFLPYLHGERAPIWNADARALFFGLTYGHEQRHLMRAVMEGVCYNMFQIGSALEEVIGPIRHIYASGGFTHSTVWLQMVADVFGRTVYTTNTADASAIGACIMGFYALRIIPDLGTASRMIHVKDKYDPDEGRHDIYRGGYEKFITLYDRLKDLM